MGTVLAEKIWEFSKNYSKIQLSIEDEQRLQIEKYFKTIKHLFLLKWFMIWKQIPVIESSGQLESFAPKDSTFDEWLKDRQ